MVAARDYYHRVPAALFSPIRASNTARKPAFFALANTTPNLCRKLYSHKEMVKTTLFGPIVVNKSKFYMSENKDYDTIRRNDVFSNCNVIHKHIMHNAWFIMNLTINLKSGRPPDDHNVYSQLYAEIKSAKAICHRCNITLPCMSVFIRDVQRGSRALIEGLWALCAFWFKSLNAIPAFW